MHRTLRYGAYAVTVLLMAVAVLGIQRLMMVPPVYSSIHQMGERAGMVLPQGYNDRPRQPSDMRVSLEPGPAVVTVNRTERTDTDSTVPAKPAVAGFDMRVVAVIAVFYLTSLCFVSMGMRWKSRRRDGAPSPQAGVLFASMILGGGVGVLSAGLLSAMRIFWTGVDSSFYSRSILQVPGSSSMRVRGDLLLAMSGTELVMMMTAMVLTAVPLLIWIDLRLMRGPRAAQPRRADRGQGDWRSIFSIFSRHRLVSARLSEHSLRWVSVACYVLVTALLWAAPWSTTMAQALWG